MPDVIHVSVVYADLNRQIECRVEVQAHATVEDAISASAIESKLPAAFTPSAIAIFGRKATAKTRLHDGDRIELCRDLQVDPKLARARRARSQVKKKYNQP